MSESRTFPLADVLSVTTGRMLSRTRMDGMGALLNYMTGQDRFTDRMIPARATLAAANAAKAALIEQRPFLADLKPPADADPADLMAWLIEVERVHGEEITVAPLPRLADAIRAAAESMATAVEGASAGFRRFADGFTAAEAREVAGHPDLAEVNVRLDGFYDKPA